MRDEPNAETGGLLVSDEDKTTKTPIGDALKKRLKKRKQTEYGLSIQDDEESPTIND